MVAKPMKWSALAIGACLVSFGLMALAAVLFVSDEHGDEMQRLALFFGLISLVVPALLAMLRADQSASNTNGKLDARIQAAVHRANAARRAGDEPARPQDIEGME